MAPRCIDATPSWARRVDGRWGLLRVRALADGAAVSVAVSGPSDLPEVCPLRVCTLEG